MASADVRDSRGFFMLPQGYEGGGFYTYGTPTGGRCQYAHPTLLTAVLRIAAMWCAADPRKFGIGNISLADGKKADHKTHRSGLEVDIRPLRLDGKHTACTIRDAQYDRAGTHALIRMFAASGMVKEILFNDPGGIARVRSFARHDDHFHVAFRA